MEKKTTVGPKGQIVIPKDIRDKIGIKEYSEVIVDAVGDSVIIKKLKPASVTYVDYYCTTYSKKLTKRMDIKKLIEEQYERNILH
ncbi:MAG: AbrB/MazE/SpoVT family DNA-binding domain-containing protein [Candidatus Thermoplasmatota archaeon]|nr:AbrB/MazE/SpoVT family DNA-binding domain-containing protein [Candidatus Thermoplasmatota archaeon]